MPRSSSGFNVDLDTTAVERGVGAVDADERRQAFHRVILQDYVSQLLLPFGHGREADALRRLGNAQDHPRVLHGKEPLRHDHIQVHGGYQRGHGHGQGGQPPTKNHLKVWS